VPPRLCRGGLRSGWSATLGNRSACSVGPRVGEGTSLSVSVRRKWAPLSEHPGPRCQTAEREEEPWHDPAVVRLARPWIVDASRGLRPAYESSPCPSTTKEPMSMVRRRPGPGELLLTRPCPDAGAMFRTTYLVPRQKFLRNTQERRMVKL
jgi:hypothetical protein